MQGSIEEIEVSTQLVVPGLLRLVGDSLFNIIVVLCGMLHVVVATHSILLMGIEVGLQNVREHLDVIASRAVAL